MKKHKTKKVKKTTDISTKSQEWKMVGRGTIVVNGQQYKSGDTFEAKESDLPAAFKNVIEKVESDKEIKTTSITKKRRIGEPTMVRLKGGTYNVYNAKGKLVNEEPVSRGKAVELFEQLTV